MDIPHFASRIKNCLHYINRSWANNKSVAWGCGGSEKPSDTNVFSTNSFFSAPKGNSKDIIGGEEAVSGRRPLWYGNSQTEQCLRISAIRKLWEIGRRYLRFLFFAPPVLFYVFLYGFFVLCVSSLERERVVLFAYRPTLIKTKK